MQEYGWIPNDNRSVIRMISKEYGRHNRGRNRILAAAVSLCIVTMTMVFGIAYGKVQAEYTKAARSAGTTASARIEEAGSSHYRKAVALGYVKHAGRSVTVGEAFYNGGIGGAEDDAGEHEKICEIQVLDAPAWEKIIKPAYTDICGNYPKEKQEIMLSSHVLSDLGIHKPKEGMKIRLIVDIGLFRREEEEFALSGWYTDYVDRISKGYISEAKYKDWGYDLQKESDILICQSDDMDWRRLEERLYQDVAGKNSSLRIAACNTFAYDAVNRMVGSYGMAILGATVVLSGVFFLIYNVMQISMAGDVRQMGLLNTIGTTKKQMSRIYYGQIRSTLILGALAGTLFAVFLLRIMLPGILGKQYLSGYGGARELRIFRPWILLVAIMFTVTLTMGAAARVIHYVVNESCVESLHYVADVKARHSLQRSLWGKYICRKEAWKRKRLLERYKNKRRSGGNELWYMAWQNISRHRGRFLATVFSLFLGMEAFLGTVVITKGSDYTHMIERWPDFLIAGEFSEWGRQEGYGEEYKTRDAGEDPMETEGDNFYLLYGNEYDEFTPISSEVRDALLNIDGVKREESYVMEGAYMVSMISNKGLEPIADIDSDTQDHEGYTMVEGFNEDTIQILSGEEISALRQYAQDHHLAVDIDSLAKGTGVMIIHDHQLTPKETKTAEKSVGEPVCFTAMRSREEWMAWNQSSPEEQDATVEERRESETFVISGYMDSEAEGFPDIRQTWHGAEGQIYYFISEAGFEKIPTEKKTLYMELHVEEEKEPGIKAEIQNILSKENRKRREMESVAEGEKGEAGIFCICRSDLLKTAESYIKGNRQILGSISAVLLIAGLTNYFNVMITGILSRRKELEILESIGMTKRQKKGMLAAEGMYYGLITAVLLVTVGSGILRGVCLYMESRLSYFMSSYPVGWMIALIAGLTGIGCVASVLVDSAGGD